MQNTDICYLSITEASKLIARRKLSPVEVVKAHLERIEQTDGRVNSFITLLKDESLAEAKKAERAVQAGTLLGPLHGIPIGLKDLFNTKGIRTTAGSKIMQDFVPDADATVVEKLHGAGAIIIGKLHMHEFAFGPTSANPHYGPAHNPWNLEHIPGGSSGGSGSSVAAGQCMGAMGSDTGGSIRIPSSLCGIVGLKPSFGRVSRHGTYPLSWSLDTMGPMARTARDVALMLNAIAGYDPRDPSSSNTPAEDFTASLDKGLNGMKIGMPREYFYDLIDPQVKEAVFKAARLMEKLGASVDEVSIPMLSYSLAISNPILYGEAGEIHLEHLRNRAAGFGADVRGRVEVGLLTSATDYIKAQRARVLFNSQINEVMQRVDLLMAPSSPISAPRIGAETAPVGEEALPVMAMISRATRPFNICGLPAVSVPCGFTSSDLPIGMQLAGRMFGEATVLRGAEAYQQATDWHTRRPPI